MSRILSRLLVRVAIALASLAWAGFVFNHTVGDPGRGERIAAAVLDDDAARAEITAPITDSVMSTTGLPEDQRAFVAGQVDVLLQDPQGAQAFIDPFAGSWARMLGEDDPRPPQFDVAPLLDDIAAIYGQAPPVVESFPVGQVPLPRVELGWMGGVRRTVDAAVAPLAVLAAGLFAIAFIIGDRARVLRRLGAWAFGAGVMWVVIPPLTVWAARRWAPGADSVAAAAVDEATAGLLPVALTLVIGGVIAFASSFVVPDGGWTPAPASEPRQHRRRNAEATAVAPPPAPPARTEPTRVMPAVPIAAATTQIPAQPAGAPKPATPEDPDDIWDFYSTS